jgi:outer membrane lipoprotein LolB
VFILLFRFHRFLHCLRLSRLSHLLAILLLALLTSCTSLDKQYPGIANPNFAQHQAAVLTQQNWQLQGRLNVVQQKTHQNKQSDTVAIHWQQQAEHVDLTLRSVVLGLGTTQIVGSDTGLTINRAGQESVSLPNLQSLTRDYLNFEFPASYLLYWVRGLPVPELPVRTEFDDKNLLTTLHQRDHQGRTWELSFDRYTAVDSQPMPGRIRLNTDNLQLTFLIDEWQFPTP